jgi:hypothetical protein
LGVVVRRKRGRERKEESGTSLTSLDAPPYTRERESGGWRMNELQESFNNKNTPVCNSICAENYEVLVKSTPRSVRTQVLSPDLFR